MSSVLDQVVKAAAEKQRIAFYARKIKEDRLRRQWIPHVPTERQKLFIDLTCKEAFFGGAAGGGKSDALLMAALQYVHRPGYAAILFRRTYADLSLPKALMSRAKEWLAKSGAKWKDTEKTWVFPSGATLSFGYLETENDKFRYQSAEFQFIGFDEASQFTESQYVYLFSRLRRLKDSNIPLRMRTASNPGGVGAQWVYERFIPEDFTPQQAREIKAFEKHGVNDENELTTRVFVPSMLEDNPFLDQVSYRESLNELDPVTRAQLLRGDWTIKARGNILDMWDERVHVITWSEFAGVFGWDRIPPTWLLGIYQDWGTTVEHPCVTTWFATAGQNSPIVNGVRMAGSVFAYRGFMTMNATVRQVAVELANRMAVDGERARVQKWQMSHEASSERLAYQREHQLPFQSWPTGKNRGIAQLRNALELIEVDKPHPFRPELPGHPKLYFIVDDKEWINPKTDAGFVRHRAEAPAYRWATLKSGEATTSLVPHALFNDAMDTVRAAAADYWPIVKGLSMQEQIEAKLHPSLQQVALTEETNSEILQMKIQSRELYLKRMAAEAARTSRPTVPQVRFRR